MMMMMMMMMTVMELVFNLSWFQVPLAALPVTFRTSDKERTFQSLTDPVTGTLDTKEPPLVHLHQATD